MRISKSFLFSVLALIYYQTPGWSQGFRIDSSIWDQEGAYFDRWDSVQNRLIMYRDIKSSGAAAAKIFKNDGSSASIYPLADLSETWSVSLWGVAATPDGGIVASVVPTYSAPGVKPVSVKEFLLTYNGTGKLTKVWDVSPYHYMRVAVDRIGNVFAFGVSNLDPPYPLVVKYSPSGNIEREFLSSADAPGGEFAAMNGSLYGDPDMFIKGDQLFVWLSHSLDLFCYSLAGELVSKTSVASALNGLAASTNSDHARVQSLTTGEHGEIFAQVQLWPPDLVKTVMVSIPPDGSRATVLAAPPIFGFFLGRTDQGKMVFYEPQPALKGGTLNEY
jgi:hypothetical protein